MKILYVVRGLPNAGKSTLAATLAPDFNVAADDYHTDDEGVYRFVPDRIQEAHAWCRGEVEFYLYRGLGPVAVHNTFTQQCDMQPYVDMAKAYGYRLSVITVERSHDGDNRHGVKPEHLLAMRDRWESFVWDGGQ